MIPESKNITAEGSALATHYSGNSQGRGYTKSGKPRPQCNHCNKMDHTKETCWKLHGKPTDWKPKAEREAHAHAVATDQANQFGQLSREQLEILQQLMSQYSAKKSSIGPSETHISLFASQGIQSTAFLALNQFKQNQVLDSGATEHDWLQTSS